MPGVGEEQVRRVRHQARGRHDGVLLLAEKIEERLADLGAGHHGSMDAGGLKKEAKLADPAKGKAN